MFKNVICLLSVIWLDMYVRAEKTTGQKKKKKPVGNQPAITTKNQSIKNQAQKKKTKPEDKNPEWKPLDWNEQALIEKSKRTQKGETSLPFQFVIDFN